jgi:hypothetical protein
MRLRYSAVMTQLRAPVVLAALLGLLAAGVARGQTSLDVLEKDLDEVKQQRQDATSQGFLNLITQLDKADSSADAALQLFQSSGGTLPAPTQVTTRYEHETPTEKAARLQRDQNILTSFGAMVQLHCGMMRIAATYVMKPDTAHLHEDWIAWLKNAAQIYPQLTGADDVRTMSMKDSPISAYLDFHGWGDKEQGKWTVHELPKFYRAEVLEPLRNPVVADALPAWDSYIALRNANQPDNNRWNNDELPELQFEKAADDFALAPGTEKLQALVDLIKAHPNHAKVDDWIAQVHTMLSAYKAQHGDAAPTNSAPAAAVAPAPAPAGG